MAFVLTELRGREEPVGAPDIPKLGVPFTMTRVGNRIQAQTVEQDSPLEIAQCVYAVLATEYGSREEEPEFGLPDQAFQGADLDQIRDVLNEWEDRSEEVTDAVLGELVDAVEVGL